MIAWFEKKDKNENFKSHFRGGIGGVCF